MIEEADRPIMLELLEVLKTLAGRVEREHGVARVLTNLGSYQDSKHLHFHVNSGDLLFPRTPSPREDGRIPSMENQHPAVLPTPDPEGMESD